MDKAKIVFFIDWFYPAFKAGGPIKSVYNLANLIQNSYDVLVVTSDRDIDGAQVSEVLNKEVRLESGLKVIYLKTDIQFVNHALRIIKEFSPDYLHLNSLFSKYFSIVPILLSIYSNRKLILAPRGMLTDEALRIKSFKKKLFIFFSKFLFKIANVVFHASTNHEVAQITASYGKGFQVKIAQNVSSSPSLRNIERLSADVDQVRLVFISRISPIKNLLWFLNIFKKLNNTKLVLDIFGPLEDERYWEKCNEVISGNDKIKYKGVLKPDEVAGVLGKYHFFVLPSGNENFGHSIVESIANGVPVIISDRTPWLDLKSNDVGFDLSLSDENAWSSALNETINIIKNQKEYSKMVKACYQYSVNFILNDSIRNQNLNLFKKNE